MTGLVTFLRGLALPFQWWCVVAPWEQGVRVRWGKRVKRLGAGIHFRIPFVDRIYLIGVRLRMVSDSGQTIMTRDGRAVSVTVALQYSVSDAERLLNSIANPEMTLLMRVHATIAEAISKRESSDLSYEEIQRAACVAVPEAWGLSEVQVRITSFAIVRTYRLLMNEYRTTSGLDQVVSNEENRRGAA